VLTRYRDHFGDLDAMSTLRFLADQVKETVLEKTSARGLADRLAAATPGRGDADVLDRTWQRDMFAWREDHVVAGLARRLRRAVSADQDDPDATFEALNRVQPHALAAGRAHVHRIVLDAFDAAVGRCTRDGTRALLDRICDLYALAQIEADRAWFLEHGRLTPTGAKALGATVDDLCRELRGHVGVLVDGLGIPEAWLPTALG
jgi:acyl-CoA oxidase